MKLIAPEITAGNADAGGDGYLMAPRVLRLESSDLVFLEDDDFTAYLQPQSLPRWITFYKKLRDRKGGKYADKYQPTIDALEEVLRGMDERTRTDTGQHSPAPRSQDRRNG